MAAALSAALQISSAAAATGDEFALPCLQTSATSSAAPVGCLDSSGVRALAIAARRRTSLTPSLAAEAVRAGSPASFAQPLLIWQGTGATAPLPQNEADALGHFLRLGGMLLVDPAEPAPNAGRAAFLQGVTATLQRALGPFELSSIPRDHVLYRSFYLLSGVGGTRPLAQGLVVGRKAGVVVTPQPWLSALATDAAGEWAHPHAGAPAEREQRMRDAINWLMYALCLDYKDDQVHLPYLLERRGG